MRVFWTDAALGQLESIRDYFARTSPKYAQKLVERPVNRSEKVADFPRSGRMVPEYEIDEVRQVIEGQYRIIYSKSSPLSTRLARDYHKIEPAVKLHVSRGAINKCQSTKTSSRSDSKA